MSQNRDYYAKDVTGAIELACSELGRPQDDLLIEVLETGTAGIFGLCRKKAHIRATVKGETAGKKPVKKEKIVPVPVSEEVQIQAGEVRQQASGGKVEEPVAPKPEIDEKLLDSEVTAPQETRVPKAKAVEEIVEPIAELPDALLQLVRQNIETVCALMGCPGTVTVTQHQAMLNCHISGEHEEVLIGEEGRALDSLQYLIRKMMIRELPEQIALNLDAGNFRKHRLEELKAKALSLAAEVKENGKTQSIPALSPSERREIHMLLQEDKEVHSRSVGDGLFKKILIYKPSKGPRPGSRNRPPKGRQERGNSKE